MLQNKHQLLQAQSDCSTHERLDTEWHHWGCGQILDSRCWYTWTKSHHKWLCSQYTLSLKLTLDISLACHLRCAVASSSGLNPSIIFALMLALNLALKRSMGDLRNPGVRWSLESLSPESTVVNRSLIVCLFRLLRKTTNSERLSLKYISSLIYN